MLLRRVVLTKPHQKESKFSIKKRYREEYFFTFLSYPLVRFMCADPSRFIFIPMGKGEKS
jgi:hypothetical protein